MKLAVLGLGFMGSTHLKALKAIPDVTVAAVCSDVEASLTGDLTAIQGNIGGPGERFDFSNVKGYREVEPILADPEIEAVDICLPTHMHAAVAIEALRAGWERSPYPPPSWASVPDDDPPPPTQS